MKSEVKGRAKAALLVGWWVGVSLLTSILGIPAVLLMLTLAAVAAAVTAGWTVFKMGEDGMAAWGESIVKDFTKPIKTAKQRKKERDGEGEDEPPMPTSTTFRVTKRKKMSPAARARLSKVMKAKWAERKAGK